MSDAEPTAETEANLPAQRETVDEPGKVLRLSSMTRSLLEELQKVEALDEPGRRRLVEIHKQVIDELGDAVSDDLEAELDRLFEPFDHAADHTDSELRIAYAQLRGWFEGLFHGFQATAVMQQLAAQQELASRQATAIPAEAKERPGTYL